MLFVVFCGRNTSVKKVLCKGRKPNRSVMKKIAIAVLMAGALIASAQSNNRVSWIPTTASEITNYIRGEINSISVGLWNVTNNSWVSLSDNQQHRLGLDSWEPQALESATSNLVWKCLSGVSNSVSGTDSYYVWVSWDSLYGTNGINWSDCPGDFGDYGLIYGSALTMQSPVFNFSLGGSPFIPPQAFSLPCDWLAGYAVIPAVNKGVRWVDYFCPLYGLVETTNGTTCSLYTGNTNFLYLESPYLADNIQGIGTLTIWYDDAKTDGTRWRWDGSGVVKVEIPSLAIVPGSDGLKITLTGSPGRAYSLESVTLGTALFQGATAPPTRTADASGVAVWTVSPTNSSGFFRARLN